MNTTKTVSASCQSFSIGGRKGAAVKERKNSDIRKTSQEQKNGSSAGTKCSVAEKASLICYSHQASPTERQLEHPLGRRYRVGDWHAPGCPLHHSLGRHRCC